MKLLFITQYFDPEIFRGNDIAYYLAKNGYEVTVITGTPNYPKGKFFSGYSWFKRNKEKINGVKIIRVPIIPRGKNSIQLVLNYLSYLISASIFIVFHLLKHNYDKCFVQQLSPVLMSFPGVIFKKITKQPLVTWVLDIWPESLQAVTDINNKLVLNFFRFFVKAQYKHSDKILLSTNEFLSKVLEYGDYSQKCIYFPQWSDCDCDRNLPLPVQFPNKFNVVYTGNLGESQDLESVVECAKLLSDDENICFVIIGDGRKFEWLTHQISQYSLNNRIKTLGRYPAEYMNSFMNNADVLFASLKDNEIFNLTVPAKIQSYMSVGKPIVVMMNGAGYSLIQESRCGYSVKASCPKELVSTLRKLKNMAENERMKLGENGKKYYEKFFEKERCLANLLEILE